VIRAYPNFFIGGNVFYKMAIENYNATIKLIKDLAENARFFEIELDREMEFNAGQFVNLVFEEEGRKFVRPYSICSSPSIKKSLELTIGLVEGGEFTSPLWKKEEGDSVGVKGPMGGFCVKETFAKDLLFIGAGTGIAPLRGMIKDCIERGFKAKMYLLFGERHEDRIFFEDEFEGMMEEHENFKFLKILSKPGDNWEGSNGYVQDNVDKLGIEDFSNVRAYICGRNGMVDSVRSKLLEKGVLAGDIFVEKYG